MKKRRVGMVYFEIERCKGCGFCVEFCPSGILRFSTTYNEKGYHYPVAEHPEKCTGCNNCGLYCPDYAIWGEASEDNPE
ncbi:MAG: 4Fe-4S binding protein [Oligoflexia bacterium]|nr:4Fe-4S binding protein [Oligoflexia bacterium]